MSEIHNNLWFELNSERNNQIPLNNVCKTKKATHIKHTAAVPKYKRIVTEII